MKTGFVFIAAVSTESALSLLKETVMKLDVHKMTDAPIWSIEHFLNEVQPEFTANSWVQLQDLPSDYSHDEALLLCQLSHDEWVAWVPQHGEVILHAHQFCALH
ncbi:hypothetical protein [Gloeocapsopsis crepidinum]